MTTESFARRIAAMNAMYRLPAHEKPTLPADTADWSHRLALVYETPCRCAGIQLYASFPFRGGHLLKAPSIGVFLDLRSLGSFGLSST